MSFIASLLTEILISTGVAGANSNKKKVFYYIFGAVTLVVCLSALVLTIFWFEPISVEKYYSDEITYKMVYGRGDRDRREIILETEGEKYFIRHYLWPKGIQELQILGLLEKSNRAIIWTGEKGSWNLKGTSTDHFKIDPSVGSANDISTRRLWIGLLSVFSFAGLLIIVIAYFDSSYL
jgi:hypothetical protein